MVAIGPDRLSDRPDRAGQAGDERAEGAFDEGLAGRALARLIASEIRPDTGPVIARGARQADRAFIEFGSEFAVALPARYPAARTSWMDAARLDTVELFGCPPAGAVVSGLPLLSISPRKVRAILMGAFGKTRTDGACSPFTYGPRGPVPPRLLALLGLEAGRVGRTLAHLPPAAVYRLRRMSHARPKDTAPLLAPALAP